MTVLKTASFPPDSPSSTPPGGGGGGGGGGERAEGGQGDQPVVRELWFIVVMAAIALLLLAIVLGVMLHKVSDSYFVSSVTAKKGMVPTPQVSVSEWKRKSSFISKKTGCVVQYSVTSSVLSFHDPAQGPEQTALHQRETPAGGPAHAEEEPHGCLSTQQLHFGEETFIY